MVLLGVGALTLGGICAEAQAAPRRIYAVIVAHNGSVDPGVAPLKYADDDGARYHELFSAIADEVHLHATLDTDTQLLFDGLAAKTEPPTHDAVARTFREVAEKMRQDEAAGSETVLFAVFTGHGAVDEDGVGYLSLHDSRWTRDDLQREVIGPQVADATHVIVDACNAYYLVRSRGGEARTGESLDDELWAFMEQKSETRRAKRVGFLLSTSGVAEVHEWSRYGAGVFSHQLRSGMLGAADVDGDMQVTYGELSAFLAAANARVTNPLARLRYFAQPPSGAEDVPLTDLRHVRRATLLEFGRGAAGQYYVEDGRGLRYADVHVAGDSPLHLVLLWDPLWRAPRYFVRTPTTEVTVGPDTGKGGLARVDDLTFEARAEASRGGVEEAFRSQLFAAPFGLAFYEGYQTRAREAARLAEALPTASDASLPLSVGLRLSWYASPPAFDLGGFQNNVDAAVEFWLTERLALGIFGDYGTSGHDAAMAGESSFRLHRVAVGVSAAWVQPLAAGFSLGVDGRTGHEWLLHDGQDATRADTLALRTQVALRLGYAVGGGVSVGLRGGAGLDVLTLDGRESLDVLPFGGAVIELRR